jgi:hypothetical protein
MWDVGRKKHLLSLGFLAKAIALAHLARAEVRDWRTSRRRRAAARTEETRQKDQLHDDPLDVRLTQVVPAVVLIGIVVGGVIAVEVADRTRVAAWAGFGAEEVSQTSFIYWTGEPTHVSRSIAPDLNDKSFSVTVQLNIPHTGATGMIITQGGLAGGWAFYVQDGKPAFHYNAAGVAQYKITAQRQLEVGDYALTFAFNRDTDGKGNGGTGVISANGVPIAQGRIERTIPVLVPSEEGLDIGEDRGTPVNVEYDLPFKFTGRIKQVAVQVFEPRKVIAIPVPPLVHR